MIPNEMGGQSFDDLFIVIITLRLQSYVHDCLSEVAAVQEKQINN